MGKITPSGSLFCSMAAADDAADPDAVAAHIHRLLLPLGVQVRGLHGLGIFITQLEDMAHFNAPEEFQGRPATGTGVGAGYLPQVAKALMVRSRPGFTLV